MSGRVTVAIALGSNLGDRAAHLRYAISRLTELLDAIRVSTVIETVPVGAAGPQGLFLNAAATGATVRPPRALLEALLAVEDARGRTRPHPNAARTLDLDLILHGDSVCDEPGLVLPHPRFRERRFVLEPLAEIAPTLRDPVTGLTVGELLRKLEGEG